MSIRQGVAVSTDAIAAESTRFGLVVPDATPREVVARISRDVNAAMNQPKIRSRMADIGLQPLGTTPAEFDSFIKAEIDKWAQVVKVSGATAD